MIHSVVLILYMHVTETDRRFGVTATRAVIDHVTIWFAICHVPFVIHWNRAENFDDTFMTRVMNVSWKFSVWYVHGSRLLVW